jgi:hypothetical protein
MSLVTDFLATPFGRQVRDYVIQQLSRYATEYVQGNIVSVEFRTAYTAPVIWSGADLAQLIKDRADVKEDQPLSAAPDGSGNSFLNKLRPTLIITFKSGEKVVAPYGAVSAGAWRTNRASLYKIAFGIVTLWTVASVVGGYWLGKRAR